MYFFLQAITTRCWIVSINWVKECLRQDILLTPDAYEVLDTNQVPGPRRSRLFPKASKLFDGFEICINGTLSCISKEDLTQLLKEEGAQIVRSVHSMSFKKNVKGMIIIDSKNEVAEKDAERNWKAFKLVTVTKHWCMDSLSGFSIKSVFQDLVYNVDMLEITMLGYK